MASIGGYNFITIKGQINGFHERLETFNRPGVDGTSFRSLGSRSEISNIESTVDLPYQASAANNMAAYRNMVSTVVTIVDDHGVSWTNMLILGVREVSARTIIKGTGGYYTNPALIHVVAWEIQAL